MASATAVAAAQKRRKAAKAKAAARARQARLEAAEAAAARKRKAQARERTAALAAAAPTATTASAGNARTFPLAEEVLLGLAALLILFSLAPARAAYAVGPRTGQALAQSRLAIGGAGVAMAIGLLVALGLGGGS